MFNDLICDLLSGQKNIFFDLDICVLLSTKGGMYVRTTADFLSLKN